MSYSCFYRMEIQSWSLGKKEYFKKAVAATSFGPCEFRCSVYREIVSKYLKTKTSEYFFWIFGTRNELDYNKLNRTNYFIIYLR